MTPSEYEAGKIAAGVQAVQQDTTEIKAMLAAHIANYNQTCKEVAALQVEVSGFKKVADRIGGVVAGVAVGLALIAIKVIAWMFGKSGGPTQ